MTRLDLDDGIVDWATEYPRAIDLFAQHGIDYCCGGKSLRYACELAGADPNDILRQLDAIVASAQDNAATDVGSSRNDTPKQTQGRQNHE